MRIKKSKWFKEMLDSVKDTPEFKRETRKLEKEWGKDDRLKTPLGKKLMKIRNRGIESGMKLLSRKEIEDRKK
jgi:hypothetical protein